MDISYKLYDSIESFRPKGQDLSFGELVFSFQRYPRYSPTLPDEALELTLKSDFVLGTSLGCLATILAVLYVKPGVRNAECTERLLTKILEIARFRKFQGKWDLVGRILSRDIHRRGIHGYFLVIGEKFSSNKFYGTLLPLTHQIIRKNLTYQSQLRQYQEVTGKDRFRGVKRTQRRRGYNDKGTLRPNHVTPKGKFFTEEELQKEREVRDRYHLPDPISNRCAWYGNGRDRTSNSRQREGGDFL